MLLCLQFYTGISLSRCKIWLHRVSPDGEPSGYHLPSPLKRAVRAVLRRLGYLSPPIHSRARLRWTRENTLSSTFALFETMVNKVVTVQGAPGPVKWGHARPPIFSEHGGPCGLY